MNKLEVLKNQYNILLQLLLKYGDSSINPQISQIKLILERLNKVSAKESEFVILERVRKMNDSLYPPRGGLSEFYIWSDNFDERVRLNNPLDDAKKLIWKLLTQLSQFKNRGDCLILQVSRQVN